MEGSAQRGTRPRRGKAGIHRAAVAQLAVSLESWRGRPACFGCHHLLASGSQRGIGWLFVALAPSSQHYCEVLCMQPPVCRQDSLIKMLVPTRHYVRDSLLPPDFTCLQKMRTFYYRTVDLCSKGRDRNADIFIPALLFGIPYGKPSLRATRGITALRSSTRPPDCSNLLPCPKHSYFSTGLMTRHKSSLPQASTMG
ncbi:hypothetical protein EV702DRAFT_110566 [Suillus placidus]|uniref:Uncharacterized protein n=1 Tax=Suillus placidus TaxID=48579 RepID=A0A9P7CW02_9AGAM|nr:hypothetical protein EV702DRAFT_110566 [Suillus placidus]